MSVEKLKELRKSMYYYFDAQTAINELIDILIESSAVASDRTQPVVEVGGGQDTTAGGNATACAPTPADPRDELIRWLLGAIDSECWEDRIVVRQKAKAMGY